MNMNKLYLILAMLLVFTAAVSAAQPQVMTVLLRPLTAGGLVQVSSNFDYEFNFTSDNACSSVLYAIQKPVTTSVYGEAIVELDTSSFTTVPEYICEYRNGTLSNVHNFSSPIFSRVLAQDIVVANNITPESNVTSWIGSVSNWFKNIYAQTFYEAGVALSQKYLSISRSVTDYYNMSAIETMNSSIRGLTRGNTSTEIWDVVNNGTYITDYRNLSEADVDAYTDNNGYLTSYRNLTDNDISVFGYIKSAALSPYLTLSRAVTDYYNKTEILALGYISSYRNLTDGDITNFGYIKSAPGNSTSEIWDVANNGTFITGYRNLTEADVDAYVSNNGYLTEYRNLTSADIATLGFITSYRNLTEADVDAYISNNGYLTEYRNLTEADVDTYVSNNGYLTSFTDSNASTECSSDQVLLGNTTCLSITSLPAQLGNSLSLSRAETDYYNQTILETMNASIRATIRGNTSEEMLAATRDTYVNITGDSMTGNLDMGGNNITDIQKILFDTDGCDEESVSGTVCWNNAFSTLNIVSGLGNVLQVGQELTSTAKNIHGYTIYAGQIVSYRGSQGEVPTITLADASDGNLLHNLGMVTQPSCNNNAACQVTKLGLVNDLDTSDYTEGDVLYLRADEEGNVSVTPAAFPNYNAYIGTVLREHQSEGIIFFNPEIDVGDGVVFNSLSLITNLTVQEYITAKDVTLANMSLGDSTYSTVNDFFSLYASAGRITGGLIVNNNDDDKINVSAGTGLIRIADDDVSQLKFFDWPATNELTIPADSVRHVVVEYNGGDPRVVLYASNTWDLDTSFPLGKAVNDDSSAIHILSNPWWVGDSVTNLIEKSQAVGKIIRDESVGGLSLSVPGTRNVAVTAGTLWARLNEFEISALDTSVTGTVELYWRNSTGHWFDEDKEQYNVSYYNDITEDELQPISNNQYANFWVYAEADDAEISLVYPQSTYATSATAEAASPPTTLPAHISENGILIGRILFQEGTDAPIEVQSAFGTVFTASQATDHGNLAGLSDNDHPQYRLVSDDRNLTDNDISVLGYIKSAALAPYLTLSRAVTDYYNKTEILAFGYIDSYRNLTDGDITNFGYIKSAALSPYLTLSRSVTDYYNKTEILAFGYIDSYRNLTEGDITNYGFTKDTASNLSKQNIEDFGFRPLNQDLNTTDGPTFDSVDVTNNITMLGTTNGVFWNNGTHLIIG